MEPQHDPPKTLRHKCSACFKQYKKKEHLIEHMRVSYHSSHQPKCGVCKKHCKSLESVREHLAGPLPKGNCAKIFSDLGCDLCLNFFESSNTLWVHQSTCRFAPASSPGLMAKPLVEKRSLSGMEIDADKGPELVALDCEMVGGGTDGSLDLCARVCLIDQNENVIFHSFVEPVIPVTNYRYEVTGITEEHLVDAAPLTEVRKRVEEILYNGEALWKARNEGGKARILVGHDLDHDLDCLKMSYPDHLIRDTAKYQPLMRTNLVSHSLEYLTKTYLGYKIQAGAHDPYEDCVAAIRLYKRMRSQLHQTEGFSPLNDTNDFGADHKKANPFDSPRPKDLLKMSPDALLQISASKYRCWCLDTKQPQ